MSSGVNARPDAVGRRHCRSRGHAGAFISELTRGRPATWGGDRGATAVEYALMAGLIAVVIVVSVTAFGISVSKLFLVPSSVFHP